MELTTPGTGVRARWRRSVVAATAGLASCLMAAPVSLLSATGAAAAAPTYTKAWSVATTEAQRPVMVGGKIATIENGTPDTVRFRSQANGAFVAPTITLPADVTARGLAAHGTTGLVVAGTDVGDAGDQTDDQVFVAEYSTATGGLVWSTTYGQAPQAGSPTIGRDQAYAVAVDASGAVYSASSSWTAAGSLDAVVTKLVPSGATATSPWAATYDQDGGLFDHPTDIAVSGTDVFVTGNTSSGVSAFYGWVERLTTNGTKVTGHRFEGAKYGTVTAVSRANAVEVSGGRVWVGGGLDVDVSASNGHADGFVANFAPNLTGEVLERFGTPFVQDPSIPFPPVGTGSDEVYDLVIGQHGPVAVGETDGNLGSASVLGVAGGGSGFLRVGSGVAAKLYKAPFLTGAIRGTSELYLTGGAYPGDTAAAQRFVARLNVATTPPVKPPVSPPVSPPASGGGYYLVEADGDLYAFGTARGLLKAIDPGATDNAARGATISNVVKARSGGAEAVAVEATSDGKGLWVLLADGRIVNVGSAKAAHGVAAAAMSKSVAGQAERPAALARLGNGDLWVFTSAGRIVPQFGQLPAAAKAAMDQVLALDLVGPILDAKPTLDGSGAYATASDGGVFAYDAPFHGSVPGVLASIGRTLPDQPVAGLTVDPDGSGYWLVAGDGGVFAFGAPFRGSLPAIVPFDQLVSAVNGMVPFGNGYLLVAGDGGVFNFSNKPFSGSAAELVDTTVVGITPI